MAKRWPWRFLFVPNATLAYAYDYSDKVNEALFKRVAAAESTLRQVQKVLGPGVPTCVKDCRGCEQEWESALEMVNDYFRAEVGNGRV